MKAIVQYRYGAPDVLALEDIPRPLVGDADVLVRVHAARYGGTGYRPDLLPEDARGRRGLHHVDEAVGRAHAQAHPAHDAP
ncbi:MAG: hypothetical protein OEY20_07460, partial [Gemmatimonadota bacterium]|nr:hypothetical protein [Gemmatimonadota bacterium]